MAFDIWDHFETLIANLTLLFFTSISNVSSLMKRTENSFLFENKCNNIRLVYYLFSKKSGNPEKSGGITALFTRPQLPLSFEITLMTMGDFKLSVSVYLLLGNENASNSESIARLHPLS